MESGADSRYTSSADKAYYIIRDAILSGELKPGQSLSRRNMATLAKVSTIPVIESLHRLESEGLVESRPRWGSRVILLTEEVIRDRYALREAVECHVVRILAACCPQSELKALRQMANQLDRLQAIHNLSDEYWDLHYTFHLRLAELTGHKSLVQVLHRINLFILLQRAEYSATPRLKNIPKDNHRRIVEAIAGSDAVTAENIMRAHIYSSGLVENLKR